MVGGEGGNIEIMIIEFKRKWMRSKVGLVGEKNRQG